ncbi:MAG: glycosyltransferase family 2 protein [Dehalococcoidia bacterium]|nr:glycosyltransferase family 2 protein [Dehalococcoidia bacterium]
MTQLSIIVPTYNEKENLPILVERVHHALSQIDYELIVVDDNSPDGTGELADELARERPIKVIHREGKLGLASAVIAGFEHAEGDVLGVIDADLQHPPEKIPDLYREMGHSDIVIASRYVNGGGVEDWTFTRKVISIGAKIMPHFLFAKIRNVKDPLSGFFLFRKKVTEGIQWNPIGYKILLEILVKGKHNTVTEVPYVFTGRERGKSNFNWTEQVNYLKHLYRLIRSEGELRRFIMYCAVGLSGVVVNLGILALLTEGFGMFYAFSNAIAVEASIINNFAWNEHWTFRDRQTSAYRSVLARMAKFNLVCMVGFGINEGILIFFTEVTGVYYIFSAVLGIMAVTLFNFVFNKWWTWQ